MKQFTLTFLMLLVLTGNSYADILVSNATGGILAKKLTLEAARTSLDCANKTIVVTSALTAAQSNITDAWPTDRALRVEKGGSIANSTVFTINGTFEAGQYECFTGAGAITFNVPVANPNGWFSSNQTVTLNTNFTALASAISTNLTLGTNITIPVMPEWWGDDDGALQKAITQGTTIKLSEKTYNYSSITIPDVATSKKIQGAGKHSTILHHTGTGVGITNINADSVISDLELTGTATTTILLDVFTWRTKTENIFIDGGNVVPVGIKNRYLENYYNNIYITGTTDWAFKVVGNSNMSSFRDISIREAVNGLWIDGEASYTIQSCQFETILIESNTGKGLYLAKARNNILNNFWLEANGEQANLIEFTDTTAFNSFNYLGAYPPDIINNGFSNVIADYNNSADGTIVSASNEIISTTYGGLVGVRTNYSFDSSFKGTITNDIGLGGAGITLTQDTAFGNSDLFSAKTVWTNAQLQTVGIGNGINFKNGYNAGFTLADGERYIVSFSIYVDPASLTLSEVGAYLEVSQGTFGIGTKRLEYLAKGEWIRVTYNAVSSLGAAYALRPYIYTTIKPASGTLTFWVDDIIIEKGTVGTLKTASPYFENPSATYAPLTISSGLVVSHGITTPSLPVYANNAAAITGGLTVGRQYKTATGVMMVVY